MNREQRIREIAFELWQEEGCPEGEAERHWFAAKALFEAEEAERKARGEGARASAAAGQALDASERAS
jgi:hypothetical protein